MKLLRRNVWIKTVLFWLFLSVMLCREWFRNNLQSKPITMFFIGYSILVLIVFAIYFYKLYKTPKPFRMNPFFLEFQEDERGLILDHQALSQSNQISFAIQLTLFCIASTLNLQTISFVLLVLLWGIVETIKDLIYYRALKNHYTN